MLEHWVPTCVWGTKHSGEYRSGEFPHWWKLEIPAHDVAAWSWRTMKPDCISTLLIDIVTVQLYFQLRLLEWPIYLLSLQLMTREKVTFVQHHTAITIKHQFRIRSTKSQQPPALTARIAAWASKSGFNTFVQSPTPSIFKCSLCTELDPTVLLPPFLLLVEAKARLGRGGSSTAEATAVGFLVEVALRRLALMVSISDRGNILWWWWMEECAVVRSKCLLLMDIKSILSRSSRRFRD